MGIRRGSHELKGVPGRWRPLAVTDERRPEPLPPSTQEHQVGDRVASRLARSFPGAFRAATRVATRRR